MGKNFDGPNPALKELPAEARDLILEFLDLSKAESGTQTNLHAAFVDSAELKAALSGPAKH